MQHLDEGTLQAWLDRPRSGLSASEVEAVEQHLAACSECALRADELVRHSRRTASLFAGVRPSAGPVPEYSVVVAKAGRARAGHRMRNLSWAASVIVALGVGWLGGRAARAPTVSAPEQPSAPRIASPPAPTVPPTSAPSAPTTQEAPAQAAAAQPRTVPTTGAPLSEPPAVVAAAPQPASAAPQVEVPTVILSTRPADTTLTATATSSEWTVVGRVTDDAGNPIPAAQVFIADLDVGVLSQQNGAFRLSWPRGQNDQGARRVVVTVQRIGYRQQVRDLVALSSGPVTADFGLVEETLSLDEIVITGTPGGTARRAIGNAVASAPSAAGWRPLGRAEAEAAAGFAMLSVPDLPLLGIEVSADGAIRVLQGLDGSTVLTLIERRGEALPQDRSAPSGQNSATDRVDGVSVTAVGPVSANSLRALLDRLR